MKTEFADHMRALFEQATRAFNAGDYEAAFAGLADDVEWHQGAWLPDAAVLYGRQRVIDFYRRLPDTGDWQVTVVDVDDLGDGVLLVEQVGTWTGRSSGISGDMRSFLLWEVEDGSFTRMREFATREEALANRRA